MSLDIRLHFLERRLWIRLEPEALVDVRMFDAHRLAEQADVVDDRDRGARLLHADFAMAGVIDRGDRVAACALRRIKDIRNRALPGWAADASDPSRRTMAPQRGRVVDVDQIEPRDRSQDRARSRGSIWSTSKIGRAHV